MMFAASFLFLFFCSVAVVVVTFCTTLDFTVNRNYFGPSGPFS